MRGYDGLIQKTDLKKRFLAAWLCLTLLMAGCCSGSLGETASDSAPLSLSASQWFGKTAEEAEAMLLKAGYQEDPENKTGILRDMAWKYTGAGLSPEEVVIWFDSDTRIVNMVIYTYAPDVAMFEKLISTFSLVYGAPNYTEAWEDKQGNLLLSYPESYDWAGDTVHYILVPTTLDGTVGAFDDVKKGTAGMSLRMLQPVPEEEDTVPVADVDPTPSPSPTPKPTATPKPVKVEVSVHSVTIKDSRYGTREFYIRFKNNASVSVDRIDFEIKGYNRYGELVQSYGIDTVEFYFDEIIKPGAISPSDYYYNYYLLNEATSIRLAIVRYHLTNGQTLDIPESQLKWETFQK